MSHTRLALKSLAKVASGRVCCISLYELISDNIVYLKTLVYRIRTRCSSTQIGYINSMIIQTYTSCTRVLGKSRLLYKKKKYIYKSMILKRMEKEWESVGRTEMASTRVQLSSINALEVFVYLRVLGLSNYQ